MQLATSKSKLPHKLQFDAIGTHWSIESNTELDGIKQEVANRVEEYDKTYSRFRNDSIVTKMSKGKGEYKFPDDSIALIEQYRRLYDLTEGIVSPLVGKMLSDAGYDKDYTFKTNVIEEVPQWDDVMKWHGSHVTTERPILLDFGAAGKGYLIDIISDILERNRITKYVIDASGDIKVCGINQTVGLENPLDESSIIGITMIENGSLCASATNRRQWGEWHHIVNPQTMKKANDVVATWVIAPSALEADGIATALFFEYNRKLMNEAISYVRMFSDGGIERSMNFTGELFA